MAEFTNLELKRQRESRGLKRWQVGEKLGVSQWTIERWETGQTRPQPDDVYKLQKLYKSNGMWHKWMRSHYDSYREVYPDRTDYDLARAVVSVRHAAQDVSDSQGKAERDAIDGHMDDLKQKRRYKEELKRLVSACLNALNEMEDE